MCHKLITSWVTMIGKSMYMIGHLETSQALHWPKIRGEVGHFAKLPTCLVTFIFHKGLPPRFLRSFTKKQKLNIFRMFRKM